MRFTAGADHYGFLLKNVLVARLRELGHEVEDLGTNGPDRVLVEEYALGVGRAVGCRRSDAGLLVCGTGQGMAIFANKVKGVRAALCNDLLTVRLARENNDANVLCLGSEIIGTGEAMAVLDEWLGTAYGGTEDDTLDRLRAIDQGIG